MIRLLAVVGVWLMATSANSVAPVNDAIILADGYPKTLSEYRFFHDVAATKPNERVTPYSLNSALFSDYAEKFRFVYVPEGKQAEPNGQAVFEFPVGSALIKSFGYDSDGAGVRLLETRLLLRRKEGWVALPYVWNEDGSDAVLKRAGKRLNVGFTDPSGKAREISYAVPNQNQCKGCHALNGSIAPIGPKPRNLDDGIQLQAWLKSGLVTAVPQDIIAVPNWQEERSASLDSRARAYLDINCAHCHNRNGPASNSGLFLEFDEDDKIALGIGKRPVAAGRGSGGREFAIAPGDPDQSILLYRMASVDPGIAMPELGRGVIHEEGVALIREWVTSVKDHAK